MGAKNVLLFSSLLSCPFHPSRFLFLYLFCATSPSCDCDPSSSYHSPGHPSTRFNMQSLQRKFGQMTTKSSADDSQVAILMKDFEDADTLLTKVGISVSVMTRQLTRSDHPVHQSLARCLELNCNLSKPYERRVRWHLRAHHRFRRNIVPAQACGDRPRGPGSDQPIATGI